MFKRYLFIILALMLTSCGGGESVEETLPQPIPTHQPTPEPPPPLPSKNESAHFLNTASFGANVNSIENVSRIGFANWLDEQIALPASSHVTYLQALEPTLHLAEDEKLRRRERLEAWFTHAITVTY